MGKSANCLSVCSSVVHPNVDHRLTFIFKTEGACSHLIPLFKKCSVPDLFPCAAGKKRKDSANVKVRLHDITHKTI